MKIEEKEERREKVVAGETIRCDICEAEIVRKKDQYGWHTTKNEWNFPDDDNWTWYEIDISANRSVTYGEDTVRSESFKLDICPKCIDNKLIPALRKLSIAVEWQKEENQ